MIDNRTWIWHYNVLFLNNILSGYTKQWGSSDILCDSISLTWRRNICHKNIARLMYYCVFVSWGSFWKQKKVITCIYYLPFKTFYFGFVRSRCNTCIYMYFTGNECIQKCYAIPKIVEFYVIPSYVSLCQKIHVNPEIV